MDDFDNQLELGVEHLGVLRQYYLYFGRVLVKCPIIIEGQRQFGEVKAIVSQLKIDSLPLHPYLRIGGLTNQSFLDPVGDKFGLASEAERVGGLQMIGGGEGRELYESELRLPGQNRLSNLRVHQRMVKTNISMEALPYFLALEPRTYYSFISIDFVPRSARLVCLPPLALLCQSSSSRISFMYYLSVSRFYIQVSSQHLQLFCRAHFLIFSLVALLCKEMMIFEPSSLALSRKTKSIPQSLVPKGGFMTVAYTLSPTDYSSATSLLIILYRSLQKPIQLSYYYAARQDQGSMSTPMTYLQLRAKKPTIISPKPQPKSTQVLSFRSELNARKWKTMAASLEGVECCQSAQAGECIL